MGIIELKAPRPRSTPHASAVWNFPATCVVRLPKVRKRKLGPLDAALGSRRSRRDFKRPMMLQELGDLLWHSYRTRRTARYGEVVWESRPSPSGGGCYPVQLLMLGISSLPDTLAIYNALHHTLGVCDVPTGTLGRSVSEVESCLAIGKGTVFLFLADLGRSRGRYRNPESLAWRDAGALLATIGLVAEAMRLDCCGLGLHGVPSLRKFLRMNESVVAVGGCIVAGR